MFASVPLVLTFVNEPAAMGYECQNRDTRYAENHTPCRQIEIRQGLPR